MARDDRLKKVQGVGADFLETARAKAEDFLKELSRAGGDTQDRAQGAIDDLVVGGRKGTEQLVSSIRKEIQNQLSALGLATKADLQALERRLTKSGSASGGATSTAAPAKPAAKKTTARKTTAGKATAARTAATKTAATKTAAGKATAAKAAAKKTAG